MGVQLYNPPKVLTDMRAGDVTGGNYLEILSDGSLVLRGNATVWDDLRFPATGINPPGAESDPGRNTSTGLLEFSASATNIIAGLAQLPHKWKQGSNLSPHIHWAGFTDPGENAAVIWKLEMAIVPINATWDGSTYAYSSQKTGTVVQNTHDLLDFDAVDMSAYAASGVSICMPWKLSRLGADGSDTYAAVATLLEFDIHYEIDALGSRQEYIK